MFEKAARLKLRFPFRGQCSVEDLWDLSLKDLDFIYKSLRRQQKEQEGESLLDAKSQANEVLDLQIDIVKHIVTVKLAEKEARENEAARAERKQKILAIIESKQEDELREKSVEELEALIAE